MCLYCFYIYIYNIITLFLFLTAEAVCFCDASHSYLSRYLKMTRWWWWRSRNLELMKVCWSRLFLSRMTKHSAYQTHFAASLKLKRFRLLYILKRVYYNVFKGEDTTRYSYFRWFIRTVFGNFESFIPAYYSNSC